MNVVICEDERIYLKSISEKIQHWMRIHNREDVQILYFSSTEDLLEQWDKLSADLLLLDIQFTNELNGMELAKHIRKTDEQIPIVFITSLDTFVYEGYTVSALRYLRKPVRYEEIAECMDIAYKQYTLNHNRFFAASEGSHRFLIAYQDILYFEARSPYTVVRLKDDQEELKLRMRFSELPARLNPELFVQCHRSYLVNVAHVRGIKRNELLMSNQDVLPISRPYLAGINQAFDRYYLEGNASYAVYPV